MLDRLRQDVRYAARALSRSPVFALVSIVSIAIGVGATTGIVTIANTLRRAARLDPVIALRTD
jgi:putative ABC transport system permease protein